MKLTPKGKKIKKDMNKTYGAKEATRILKLMIEEKKVTGVLIETKKRK